MVIQVLCYSVIFYRLLVGCVDFFSVAGGFILYYQHNKGTIACCRLMWFINKQ